VESGAIILPWLSTVYLHLEPHYAVKNTHRPGIELDTMGENFLPLLDCLYNLVCFFHRNL
jgi:hypothetical protein